MVDGGLYLKRKTKRLELIPLGAYGLKLLLHDLSAFERVCHYYEVFGASNEMHPMKALRTVTKLPKTTIYEAKRTPTKTFLKTSGLLLVRQKPPTANGVCFSAIEDEHGILDLILFKNEYIKFKNLFLSHCFLIIGGIIERDGHSISMIVKTMAPIFKTPSSQNTLHIEPTQYF